MKRNADPLLRELLETDALAKTRERSLGLMVRAARARRRKRQVAWASVCLLAPALWSVGHWLTPQVKPSLAVTQAPPVARSSLPAPATGDVASARVELISTEELLALFPDRPLALVGSAGNQRLVFLDKPLEEQ